MEILINGWLQKQQLQLVVQRQMEMQLDGIKTELYQRILVPESQQRQIMRMQLNLVQR